VEHHHKSLQAQTPAPPSPARTNTRGGQTPSMAPLPTTSHSFMDTNDLNNYLPIILAMSSLIVISLLALTRSMATRNEEQQKQNCCYSIWNMFTKAYAWYIHDSNTGWKLAATSGFYLGIYICATVVQTQLQAAANTSHLIDHLQTQSQSRMTRSVSTKDNNVFTSLVSQAYLDDLFENITNIQENEHQEEEKFQDNEQQEEEEIQENEHQEEEKFQENEQQEEEELQGYEQQKEEKYQKKDQIQNQFQDENEEKDQGQFQENEEEQEETTDMTTFVYNQEEDLTSLAIAIAITTLAMAIAIVSISMAIAVAMFLVTSTTRALISASSSI
jgi:hypothetical protein